MKSFIFILLMSSAVFAAEDTSKSEPEKAQLGTVHVQSSDIGLVKRHEVIKTEVIRKEAIQHKRAQTLADAVSNQVGIDAQNSCANCGSKRVTINGLRGEHTTVLIDGMPMHSAISSFYGMDAIPVVGIESIEVSRGAGASLVAPEAIGGVINIITVRPKENGLTLDSNLGTHRTGFLSVLGNAVAGEGKYRLLLAGQLSNQGAWDADGNRVSEAPDLKNQSFFVKGSGDLGPSDRLEARYARQTVTILGGVVDGVRPTAVTAQPLANENAKNLFQDNDIAGAFLGTGDQIADLVDLKRHEGMLRWNHFFGSEAQIQVSSALAEQKQSSIYMHGYDYANRDLLWFNDARVMFSLSDSLFITTGAELKNQDMSSASHKLYVVNGLAADDFSYRSRAGYLQGVWVASEEVELSTALRYDRMQVDRKSQTAQRYEIDSGMWAPRAHLKVAHGPNWTSRLTYGRGYRPPLSFFESQHGLSEAGFSMAITDIERSHSAGYSIAYARPGLAVTGSSHHTWLTGMAYAEAEAGPSGEALFKNYPSELKVWANDIVVSWDVRPDWNLQLSYENFRMQGEFKRLLPAAAVEQRARLVSDFHYGNWEFVNTINWVGPRNLAAYGYDQHFRSIHDAPIDPTDLPLGNAWQTNERKGQRAPGFFTWDIYLGWTLREKYTFYASVQNVLDTTQNKFGDSPLNFASHGNDPMHFHLDNNHTWGPLRGRIFALGFKAQL